MIRRHVLLAFMALGVLGCAGVQSGPRAERGSVMNGKQMSLWELVAGLEQQMPVTISRVEALIASKFALVKEGPPYVTLEAPGFPLADGLAVTQARMMLRPSLQFEDNSGMSLELEGACISLPQVRERFGELRLIQAPRGRSLDETEAWAVERPWGHLVFAFQQRRPDCLFRVSLLRQLP